MSKIIYVCNRNTPSSQENNNKIQAVCNDLNPENISGNPPFIYRESNIIYGISNPTSTIETKGANVLLGKMFGFENSWYKISSHTPDGNYAIFRTDENGVEVITDCLGTRSIWYYFDQGVFIASTSQKAIIKFLGSFEFDERIIPWMISTGSLGPTHSWDKRIKMVPADGSVFINKNNWTISVKTVKVELTPGAISKKESKNLLQDALLNTFNSIDLNFNKWAITLSGGHDSRAILFLLKKTKILKKPLKTITWGSKSSPNKNASDAYVAERVSRALETDHQFFPTEFTEEPIGSIIDRFLKNGEGRIDHIPAYLDGFKLWKRIYETGIEGIIRGDEIFGYNQIYSPLVVKSFMGLTLCSDFSNLKKYDYLDSLQQELPEALKQRKNESLPSWRDRIFQLYRIPYIQSALADIKYPYIEQINPFLSRRIVNIIRKLPDDLRTDKKLFKQVMKQWHLGVPFSKRDSTLKFQDILRQESFVDLMKKELRSNYANKIFPETFLYEVVQNLKIEVSTEIQRKLKFFDKLKMFIPKSIKIYIAQQNPTLHLDENLLAFRILIICRMHKELSSH